MEEGLRSNVGQAVPSSACAYLEVIADDVRGTRCRLWHDGWAQAH
jgi:hypothetical protein